MSVPMRKSNIEKMRVEIFGTRTRRFEIPKSKAGKVLKLIEGYEIDAPEKDEWIPAEDVFKDLYKKHGKPGAILKGSRLKEDLTQVALAKKLGVPQQHISEMEGGKRPIGKEMSKRLAKIFGTDYRVFL